MTKTYHAAMIVIGSEVLSGRTQDKNVNYVALGLGAAGIRLSEVRIIPDVEATIVDTVNALRRQYDYVFTSGGIGPTHDDITAASISKAFGVELTLHPKASERLHQYYGAEITDARLRMAYTPEGAKLIDNPVSAAPGFIMENVYVMAGVPKIMQAMFDGIKHTLQGGAIVYSKEISTEIPESKMAQALGNIQLDYPDVEIGSYPYMRIDKIGTCLVLRSTDTSRLEEAYNAVQTMVETASLEIIARGGF